jgi:hypothetical protein
VLGIKDGKKRFADQAVAMSKAFTLCCTLDEAKAVREEVAFLQAVKVILTKRDLTHKKKTDEERELAIRQIIGSAVVSEDVVDVFEAVGLDKPNIGILDDEFLAEVRNLPERNLAVELLERLLEGEIKSRFAGNVVQEKKFSELLANVVKRYQNRAIETAQVIEELIEMAKKFHAAASRGEELGLTEDEIRFYDALADNESAVRELSDETLKKIAHELTENLRKNLTVDWSARKRARQAAPDGQAHPAQVQVPAGSAGRGGGAGAAGEGAGRGVDGGLRESLPVNRPAFYGVRHGLAPGVRGRFDPLKREVEVMKHPRGAHGPPGAPVPVERAGGGSLTSAPRRRNSSHRPPPATASCRQPATGFRPHPRAALHRGFCSYRPALVQPPVQLQQLQDPLGGATGDPAHLGSAIPLRPGPLRRPAPGHGRPAARPGTAEPPVEDPPPAALASKQERIARLAQRKRQVIEVEKAL